MKINLEHEDIQAIAQAIMENLKPILLKTQGDSEQSIILDIQGLAEYLKVSKQWIYERTRTKSIPHLKIEGQLRFNKNDIDEWLKTYKT
jgi:excisionase family DNA binding protein